MTHALTTEPLEEPEPPFPIDDPIEAAAWFVAAQPDGPWRLLDAHRDRANGQCTGCGWYRPQRWPCVLVIIAHRAHILAQVFLKAGTP